MATIDGNNLFALVLSAVATADAIANDARQTTSDRAVAEHISTAMKAYKSAAYGFRDWTPATPAASTAAAS